MRQCLGCVGVGWIGMHRMKAVAESGIADIEFVADADPAAASAAAEAVGATVADVDAVLDRLDLDGVMVATPSALHPEQSARPLRRGVAVFCQKPLAPCAGAAARVVEAARHADRLLGVDLSYRHLAAVDAVRQALRAGDIGDVYAAELVFHNAYGPEKAWFLDPRMSGGGCVIDLGVHLVDLACSLLEWPDVEHVTSRLFAGGRAVAGQEGAVEDYAVARLDLASGAAVTLACSWWLNAGRDAVIAARFHGARGSLGIENVGGSFYDFRAVLRQGTAERVLAEPPDDWGGRAAVAWATRLAKGDRYDPEIERAVYVAAILDRIYGR